MYKPVGKDTLKDGLLCFLNCNGLFLVWLCEDTRVQEVAGWDPNPIYLMIIFSH